MANGVLPALLLQSIAVFAEPGFPVVDAPPPDPVLAELPSARAARSGDELAALLEEVDVLLWRHGSAFPAEAWVPLVAFLERGGSLLHLGGEPFTRPVVGEPGARVAQPRTVSLLKELRLTRSTRVAAGGARALHPRYADLAPRTLGPDAWVSVLEPRFSDTRDFEHEDGAPGARDAILRPLGFVHAPDGDPRFPMAAASYAIDRLRGRFAGGRWVFWLLSEPPTEGELELLLAEAARPPIDVRADPVFGCFHPGERPSINVRVHRPVADDVRDMRIDIDVRRPDGSVMSVAWGRRVGRHASEPMPLDVGGAPGLYRLTLRAEGAPPFETGFWIMDRDLFESGDALAMGTWAMERDGVAEPVVGTTVMSRSVHRKFLFEPNAAEWDETFAELASIGVNLVRTGVWSGYRKVSLDPNVVDEAFLRALEAYYLTARSHGIPVLFTFFAFVPEAFGGVSPYFDPRSIEGQRAYVSAVARRFAAAKEMLWDLVNEPSFANPDRLWVCRPNGDRFEHAAFLRWLEARYSGSPDGRSWQDVVRARWRLLPDEPIGVPTDEDFEDRHVMEHHRPYRAKEYAHFAQDAFRGWVREMTDAIRQSGSTAPITVGQDEGGLFERPSPLFHHDAVDFTSIHTWWFNDMLGWDGAMAKARATPLLVSETGVMQRELLSGDALRDPDGAADLLARKVGHAFGSGAFGVVEWCHDVNPYMASDNEVAIGLRRADGSYKPEHAVLRDFAAFFARNLGRFQGYREPTDVLLFPSGSHYGPRGRQLEASRHLLERWRRDVGSPIQVVPEYRTATDLGTPARILLPATPGISDGAWRDLLAAVERGAILETLGWFEADDAGLPAERLGLRPRRLAHQEPLQSGHSLEFDRAVTESELAADGPDRWLRIPRGAGAILHFPLPLGWDVGPSAAPDPEPERTRDPARDPGLVTTRLDFDGHRLIAAVNEQSKDAVLTAGAAEVVVPAGGCRLLLLDADGALVDVTGD